LKLNIKTFFPLPVLLDYLAEVLENSTSYTQFPFKLHLSQKYNPK
jgi:hypothetical protein